MFRHPRTLIITQTPMRITLAGGGTDVAWYSKLKGGAWISAAINKYVFVLLNRFHDGNFIRIFHEDGHIVTDNLHKIPIPIIKESLRLSQIKRGIEIIVFADVPGRSGLGGSGAFEVGLLHALCAYKGESISQRELAQKAYFIEKERLKKPIGPQDQYITAIGGINYFEVDRRGEISIEPLLINPYILDELEHNLLFFTTGIYRDTSSILVREKSATKKSSTSSQRRIKALDDIKELGQHVKKALLRGKVDEFGSSLHEHWLIKKRLSSAVTNQQIDEWYNEAIKAGALGGKIMGAGGGGWFVFYVSGSKNEFRQRMSSLGLIEQKVNFDWQGTKLLLNLG